MGIIINKIARFLNRLINPNLSDVYGLHGSFLIFPSDVLNNFKKIFDDSIFLYCEENILSINAVRNNIKLTYNPSISVLHYQDASTKYLKSQNSTLKKSYLYYYENYVKGQSNEN
jgi:GT2 family glycosyltransferase